MKWLNGYRIRFVLTGIVISGFLSMTSVCSAVEFIWMQKSDMPTPRWAHTSAVVNGRIYVFGGSTSEPDDDVLSSVEEYDPVTNTWTRKADLPTARTNMIGSSAVVNGKIYVIGGDDNVAWGGPIVEEYDPVTDTWMRKADMPTPKWSLATCAVDGKIYAIGGGGNGWAGLNVVEQYDPITDTWTRKSDLPTGLWGLCAKVVNGKIYAFGGRPSRTARNSTFEYDPSTDIWTRKASMPLATSQMASVVLGDKIVVIGGWRISSEYPYTTMQMYDPESNTWTIEGDTPFQRASFSAEVVRGRIFAIGGTDRPHPCPATSTVYECDTGYISQFCDFNGDGVVDSLDICIMVDYWGTDEWFCDIAPLPFGDGIVDVEDLIVLAEYLFEDYRLIAHWALDEEEGNIAYDSVGGNNADLYGEPIWRPIGGQVGGALDLDGIDDYINTPFVLDPSKGSFSVFAWIKGGASGQAIISQVGDFGETWLAINTPEGTLMTGFCDTYFDPLESEVVITDGQWHHIGLVYDLDTFHRRLYLDGILVAEDTTAVAGNPSDGGLYIGASKDLDAGSFFSGLIDDVRIYDMALNSDEIMEIAH